MYSMPDSVCFAIYDQLYVTISLLSIAIYCTGYIPGQRDIRPVISNGKSQCLSGAEEVPRAKPEALPRRIAFPKGCNRSYIPLARDTTNLLRQF